jgi:hypothetical protein
VGRRGRTSTSRCPSLRSPCWRPEGWMVYPFVTCLAVKMLKRMHNSLIFVGWIWMGWNHQPELYSIL